MSGVVTKASKTGQPQATALVRRLTIAISEREKGLRSTMLGSPSLFPALQNRLSNVSICLWRVRTAAFPDVHKAQHPITHIRHSQGNSIPGHQPCFAPDHDIKCRAKDRVKCFTKGNLRWKRLRLRFQVTDMPIHHTFHCPMGQMVHTILVRVRHLEMTVGGKRRGAMHTITPYSEDLFAKDE